MKKYRGFHINVALITLTVYSLPPCFLYFPLLEPKTLPKITHYGNKKITYKNTAYYQSLILLKEIQFNLDAIRDSVTSSISAVAMCTS